VADIGRMIDERRGGNAGQARARSSGDPGQEPGSSRTYAVEVSRRAMACEFSYFLNAGQYEHGTERALEALDRIEELEDQMSVYRHRSEVSLLNATADKRAVRVEHRLFGLLTESVQLFRDTRGAFDVTAGPLIKIWNRLRREGVMPSPAELTALRENVGSDKLELDETHCTVRYLRPGVTIDLGGIGKGYALDRAADLLAEHEIHDYLVHGGTSSLLARGSRKSGTELPGWMVGVQHPLRADRRLAEFQLCDRAVGTSGAGTQQFYYQGKRYGHIIDPRTGYPADGILSTTVIAPSSAVADALSTAFYVLGLVGATEYCQRHPEVSALITTPSRRGGAVELHAINCDNLIWRRCDEN
ncbi:MAG: FAD:protein FMN transferase, partial [Planctomycetales bacterium]|nr:FAD:protein FMN transferase [Planctomycetales bacterium]